MQDSADLDSGSRSGSAAAITVAAECRSRASRRFPSRRGLQHDRDCDRDGGPAAAAAAGLGLGTAAFGVHKTRTRGESLGYSNLLAHWHVHGGFGMTGNAAPDKTESRSLGRDVAEPAT